MDDYEKLMRDAHEAAQREVQRFDDAVRAGVRAAKEHAINLQEMDARIGAQASFAVPLHQVYMAPDADQQVARVLQSGYIGQGEVVEEFEDALRKFLQVPVVVTTNSATSALHLALHMLRLPVGSQVLTTPLTCMATTCAIKANLLTPVWVDVDPKTLNMDLDDLERKITKETRAIMAVHFAGNPLDLDRLYDLADRHNLAVVEDCAHALGAKYRDKQVGTFRRASAFSFQAVKPLTTGDGGCLITPSEPGAYDRARRLRWYGIDRDHRTSPVVEWGFKFHMNDIAASIGLANIPFLKQILFRQKENGAYYQEYLDAPGEGEEWCPTAVPEHGTHAYYLYPLLVRRRDAFIQAMARKGIECGPVHARNDLAPCFEYLRNETPRLDEIQDQVVCLPVGWWVSDFDRERIVEVFNQGW